MKFQQKIVAIFLAVIMCLTPSLSLAAINQEEEAVTPELQQLSDDLQFIFEEATTFENGKYIANDAKLVERFGEENLSSIHLFLNMTNGEYSIPTTPKKVNGISILKKESWSECVGDKIIAATGIGFISGGMWKMIERQAWKQLASELFFIAGKNAIKGGIVGFTATLAVWGTMCAMD